MGGSRTLAKERRVRAGEYRVQRASSTLKKPGLQRERRKSTENLPGRRKHEHENAKILQEDLESLDFTLSLEKLQDEGLALMTG